MAAPPARPCPNCNGRSFYWTRLPDYTSQLLPGLGTAIVTEDVQIVVCSECGLTRLFAPPSALRKLRETKGSTAAALWFKLVVNGATSTDLSEADQSFSASSSEIQGSTHE